MKYFYYIVLVLTLVDTSLLAQISQFDSTQDKQVLLLMRNDIYAVKKVKCFYNDSGTITSISTDSMCFFRKGDSIVMTMYNLTNGRIENAGIIIWGNRGQRLFYESIGYPVPGDKTVIEYDTCGRLISEHENKDANSFKNSFKGEYKDTLFLREKNEYDERGNLIRTVRFKRDSTPWLAEKNKYFNIGDKSIAIESEHANSFDVNSYIRKQICQIDTVLHLSTCLYFTYKGTDTAYTGKMICSYDNSWNLIKLKTFDSQDSLTQLRQIFLDSEAHDTLSTHESYAKNAQGVYAVHGQLLTKKKYNESGNPVLLTHSTNGELVSYESFHYDNEGKLLSDSLCIVYPPLDNIKEYLEWDIKKYDLEGKIIEEKKSYTDEKYCYYRTKK